MRRRIARGLFVVLAAILAAGAGTLGALIATGPGKALLVRLVSDQSNRLVRGSVTIGRVDGDFRTHLELDSVVVRDTSGALLASIPRIELRFSLAGLLAKRVVLSDVHAYEPEVQIIKHRGGRMNFQEVLRLGEGRGDGAGGPSPLVQFRNLQVFDGRLTFLTPWNPDGRLRTDRQRDSALAAERAKPGRRIEQGPPAEGYQQIRVLDDLTVRFGVLTVSSPDGRPLNGRIDTLATRMSDPGVTVRDIRGTLEQGADSLVFALERVALPATWGGAEGRIDWPRDTILYDFRFAAEALDLTDLRWISPDFPALTGQGRVAAQSVAGSRVEFDLRDLRLADARSRVSGRLIAVLDVYRGLGFRDLDLSLSDFSLEAVRPYLDTLPLAGRLSGPLRASGFFDAMSVDFDWRFSDDLVEAPNVSDVSLAGVVSMGGPDGMAFRETEIRRADLDLRSVRLVAPAVQLNGRLGLAGSLAGPWRNAVFEGRAVHRDGDRPASALSGRARLDTRGEVLALDADLALDSLSFDGLRGSFPSTPMRGGLRGTVRLAGDLERLDVTADVRGELGRVSGRGVTTLRPPRWGASGLELEFSDLDLAALNGGPSSRLNGTMRLTGRVDTLVAPVADISVRLGAGRVREAPHDSARMELSIRDSLVTVDTARVWWEGGEATARGSLGWFAPHEGRIEGDVLALALGVYDSLALAVFGKTREEAAEGDLLAGRARGRFALEGSLDRWHLDATARADSVRWLDYESRGGTGRLQWWGGRLESPRFEVSAMVDSVAVGRFQVRGVDGEVRGTPDAFAWRVGAATTSATRLGARGRFTSDSGERRVAIDSLAATVLGRTWALASPVTIASREDLATLDTIVVATDDGSGLIRVAGDFPGRASGRVVVRAFGIGLRELYAIAQRDTAGISGRVALDARLEGTRAAPTLRGSGTVTGAVIGDFRAPLLRGVYNYADRRLESNLTLWRTGTSVLDVDLSLPLDLALADVSRRQLPGTLTIRGKADSVDLAVVEAYTRNLRSVTGSARIDASVGGTWEAPRLGGLVAFRDGGAVVPGLGVRYHGLNGTVRLAGDSLVAEGLRLRSGSDGTLDVTGSVRLARLTSPVLDLSLASQDFLVMDVRDYLTLRVRAEVTLTGPLARPVLTGGATATNSVLYFSDLITKDIVNLEDPMNADLVDTTALRAQNLRAQFQSRFLDSLQIQDLRVRVGEGVWLRSNEANLQLEGRVTVNKDRWSPRAREYRVSGQLQTPRGTYTLKLGPVFRTFLVERGTLQYFNTADLDAALDVEARHVVRTVQGGGADEYPIIARITGTLLAPKLALTTASDRAPLPEADLVALLVTGATRNSLFSQSSFGWEDALALGSTVLSAELQRSLISDAGLKLDLIEIRPGLAQGNSLLATGGSVTTLAVGRQLRPRLFAILSAGACLGQNVDFSYQYLGASLEYRFHPTLKLQLAAEPVQSCLTQAAQAFGLRGVYQFAADLRWDREY